MVYTVGDKLVKTTHENGVELEASEGDWVVARVNGGTIEGTLHKINPKRFIVRLQVAGKFKYVTKRHRDLLEVVEFF